jgi:hypothetical protein
VAARRVGASSNSNVYHSRTLALSFGLLVVLIAAAPVLAITPGWWLGPQLLSLAVAALLLLLPGAPDADIRSSIAIWRPLAVAALLPAAWMLLQIIPVPSGTIEHPIWHSAEAALGETLFSHVSVDLGMTLRALFGTLGLISLAFVTSVMSRNRDRAETMLYALCAITSFIALELLLFRGSSLLRSLASPDSLVALAAFGVLLNTAFMVRATERYETRDRRQLKPRRGLVTLLLLGLTGFVICLIALLKSTTLDVLIAVTFGMTLIGVVVAVRRLGLGRWSVVTVCVSVAVAWGGVIALRFAANPAASPLFRFARVEASEAAATLRMMADANWTGDGVGSYSALAAIYRDTAGVPGATPVNTIAAMVLEWGRIGLLIALLLLLQLLYVLFRGALARGRDSFYAACAAGCLVTAFCEAFCDAGITDITVQMLAAIIVGLGLAQTAGRHAN